MNSVQNNSFMLLHNVTRAEPIAGAWGHAGEGETTLIFRAERQGSAVLGNVETWWGKVFSVK